MNGVDELKNFKELQEATHNQLCESIFKLSQKLEGTERRVLESIERKLESIINGRDGEPN